MKTFWITYYSHKDRMVISRRGTHDKLSRFGRHRITDKPYYVYYDLDAGGYRTATGHWDFMKW